MVQGVMSESGDNGGHGMTVGFFGGSIRWTGKLKEVGKRMGEWWYTW